ncbi:hypothetical protein CF319_g2831 [Tilletia indica]|nr:hypothetical protein CF319_g2831 [Tilletia indica]
MLLADVALVSGDDAGAAEAAATASTSTSTSASIGNDNLNASHMDEGGLLASASDALSPPPPPMVPQANRLNGDHPASTTADSGEVDPSSAAEAEAADAADTSGDGSQEANTSSSILSPTSTVCRGSYHQCGTARRVKVYELQNDSWFDRGTGYCAGVYDEHRDEALLVARKEEACTLLARNGPSLSASNLNEINGGAAGLAGMGMAEQDGTSGAAAGADASLLSSSTAAGAGNTSAEGGQGGPAEIMANAANRGTGTTGLGPIATPASTIVAALTASLEASASGNSTSQADDAASGTSGGNPNGVGGPAGLTGAKPLESEYVIVVTEDLNTDDVILKSRVLRDDVYQRQAETLVVWTEADGTDMALSFQEAEGCHELWEFLTEVQKHFILVDSRGGNDAYMLDPDADDSPTGTPNPNSPTHTLGFGTGSMDDVAQAIENFNLPEPKLATIAQIELQLKEAASKGQSVRDRVAEWLLRENYIQKLLPVFQDAEELESLDSLHLLCTIIQSILMLNDNAIFEHILQDDVFLGVVGMLEYDPEYPRLKASYRDYLSDPSRYRKVVEIKDEGIVRKIHQTYRLLYLKDVILARVLDDPTFSILNSFVFYNQVDIVNYCVSNEGFLTELFEIFNPERKEPDSRKFEAVFFLQQLCAMGKQIQLPNRIALYRTLTEWGLLSVVEYALGQNDQTLRNAAAEVLMTIIEYDANSVRLHILEQAEQNSKPLMTVLVDLLHNEEDLGLKTQMAEAVRVLLETASDGPSAALAAATAAHNAANGMGGGRGLIASDPDKFLSWLYDTEIDHLFSPLKELPDFRFLRGGRQLHLVQRSRSALFGHLCDLLSFTMVHHTFRSKYFLHNSQISRRVASLLSAREKHIRLSSLRFFKTCLNGNDAYTNRHFTKIDLFGAVLGLLAAEADRDNLVTSACLEFFDFIRKENMKQVISYLMENHSAQIQMLAGHYIVGKTFTGLALQFHKNSEVPPAEADNTVEEAEDARRIRDLRRRAGNRASMDAMEESYFNEDDDEQPISAAEAFSSTDASKDLTQSTSSSAPGSAPAKGSTSSSGSTVKLVDYGDDDAEHDISTTSSGGTAGADETDGSSAASTSSSSTTVSGATPTMSGIEAAAAAGNVKVSPRLKRRRSQLTEGAVADGSLDGADEDTLDRLAKKTATVAKRRSMGATAGSESSIKDGVEGDEKKKKKEEQDEDEEELEGGFVRVETPTSPSAAKTTNSGGRARSGSSSSGSGSAANGGSKKITLSLKGLGGKGKSGGAGSASSSTTAGAKPK